VEGKSHQIPRPPKTGGIHMPVPLETPLRGMPEWPGPPLEADPEPFRVEVTDHLGDLLARALELARTDDRVREYLAERRHVWLGASALDAKDEKRVSAVVVAFDYERNVAVEVAVAGENRELQVTSVEDAAYHPPPSDEEIARATELARGDRRVAGHLSDDLESSAILVSDVKQGDRHHGNRRIEIGFGRADERLPRIRALVDLGQDQVLGVHAENGHRDDHREDPS
jgi:hypothetical protein